MASARWSAPRPCSRFLFRSKFSFPFFLSGMQVNKPAPPSYLHEARGAYMPMWIEWIKGLFYFIFWVWSRPAQGRNNPHKKPTTREHRNRGDPRHTQLIGERTRRPNGSQAIGRATRHMNKMRALAWFSMLQHTKRSWRGFATLAKRNGLQCMMLARLQCFGRVEEAVS